ncbi:hypothetical protein CCMSSC00406_0007244 [Pleurotus cornucopiae]|uniref:Uncharacterized protein n=1 Tax=Pleurotus cornucopiae TaxID=5321 RepID=A0ACB7IL32_PLECO|nr:hypothetical protein CCMSSC00406_0007244 [Pleurotus cornucopiae]
MHVAGAPRRQHQWHPQEDTFADSLIPYYLQAKELNDEEAFFRAANRLLLDRFPPAKTNGVSKASGFNKMKRSLALRIEVSSLLRGRITKEFPVQGYWKDHMSIAADRERRRKDWLSVGGVPRHHQGFVTVGIGTIDCGNSKSRWPPSYPHPTYLLYRVCACVRGQLSDDFLLRSRSQVSIKEWQTLPSVGAGVVKAKRFVYHAKPAPHPRNTPSEDNTPVTPVIGFPQPFDPSDSHHLVPDVLELEKTRRRTAGVCLFESPTIHTHVKQDLPFLTWLPERDTFIKEFLWHEAAADDTAECPGCMEAVAGSYRCRLCFDKRLYCEECMVNQHQALPFHELEKWNSRFFERCSLQSLGLRLQLGHPIDRRCVRPMPSFGDVFTVITSHGLIPLLRYGLFPATTTDPRTAATFEVLRLFQMLTFGPKVSGYEFYQALMRLTNNLGGPVPDRYSAFMRIVREWRHIRLMKRMGRGHESSGVSGTNEGECAVLCPACPQPEKNLPSSWKEANESQQWIYALFLAIDANFRLKRLSASNDARDPSLNRGCAYFVEEAQYKDFLRERANTNIDEANTCNNYDAVKLASIRGGKGTTASGVGTIECSRHDMKCPV